MKFCCKGFPLGKARAGSGRPEAGGRTIELGARAPARDRHVYSCCLTQASLPAKADEPPSRSVPCVNSHRAPRCLIKLLLPDFEVSFMKPRARARVLPTLAAPTALASFWILFCLAENGWFLFGRLRPWQGTANGNFGKRPLSLGTWTAGGRVQASASISFKRIGFDGSASRARVVRVRPHGPSGRTGSSPTRRPFGLR